MSDTGTCAACGGEEMSLNQDELCELCARNDGDEFDSESSDEEMDGFGDDEDDEE